MARVRVRARTLAGARRDDHVTLTLRLHGRTALSLLVSKRGDPGEAVWLRKSNIASERAVDGDTVELTLPEWLARSEKLA